MSNTVKPVALPGPLSTGPRNNSTPSAIEVCNLDASHKLAAKLGSKFKNKLSKGLNSARKLKADKETK